MRCIEAGLVALTLGACAWAPLIPLPADGLRVVVEPSANAEWARSALGKPGPLKLIEPSLLEQPPPSGSPQLCYAARVDPRSADLVVRVETMTHVYDVSLYRETLCLDGFVSKPTRRCPQKNVSPGYVGSAFVRVALAMPGSCNQVGLLHTAWSPYERTPPGPGRSEATDNVSYRSGAKRATPEQALADANRLLPGLADHVPCILDRLTTGVDRCPIP